MRFKVEWQETVYDLDIYEDLGPDYPECKIEGPNVKPSFVIEAQSLKEGEEIALREIHGIIDGPNDSKPEEDILQKKLRLPRLLY